MASSDESASAESMALAKLIRELDVFVSTNGWDQPTRLFALALTTDLLHHEPTLTQDLAGTTTVWTPVEQEGLPAHRDLPDLLQQIRWPPTVVGVAVSAERVLEGPDKQECRVTMGALRSGDRCTVVRLRKYDNEESVIVGNELVEGLGELLMATFED